MIINQTVCGSEWPWLGLNHFKNPGLFKWSPRLQITVLISNTTRSYISRETHFMCLFSSFFLMPHCRVIETSWKSSLVSRYALHSRGQLDALGCVCSAGRSLEGLFPLCSLNFSCRCLALRILSGSPLEKDFSQQNWQFYKEIGCVYKETKNYFFTNFTGCGVTSTMLGKYF